MNSKSSPPCQYPRSWWLKNICYSLFIICTASTIILLRSIVSQALLSKIIITILAIFIIVTITQITLNKRRRQHCKPGRYTEAAQSILSVICFSFASFSASETYIHSLFIALFFGGLCAITFFTPEICKFWKKFNHK